MLHDNVLRAIDTLYGAAAGERPWSEAWDGLLDATGFQAATIYTHDRQTRAATGMAKAPASPGIWHRIDPDFGRRYNEEGYHGFDPRRRFLLDNLAHIRLRYDALHSTEAEIARDPFYALIERHGGFRYYLGAQTDPAQPVGATISLHRVKAAGHATPGEIRLFEVLLPHFERAFVLDRRLSLALGDGGLGGALLDRGTAAVLALDRHGRIIFASRAAHDILRAGDGLVLVDGGLRAMRGSDDARLQRLLGAATGPARGGGALRIARPSGRRDYALQVAALPFGARLIGSTSPAACLLVTDPELAPPSVAGLARTLFGLTASEARLADRLLAGDTIEQAAAHLGIAWATARTHLAAIFRKTETRRQAELVRLLLTLPTGGAMQ